MNIQFSYCYRDYGNNKLFNSQIFANPLNRTAIEVKEIINQHLIDDCLFYAKDWNIAELRFENCDSEIDHPFHEFEDVTETALAFDSNYTIEEILKAISIAKNKYYR